MSRKEEDFERLEAELATTRNELQFMASTEKGKLRAVNAKLLEALEECEAALRKDGERILLIRNVGLPGPPTGTMPHNLKLANQARAAIEEARK